MKIEDFDVQGFLGVMANSPISNYIVPGLTSSLIGHGKGSVRVFNATREQLCEVAPHSHRYELFCYVMRGWVDNNIWFQASDEEDIFDSFQASVFHYKGRPGQYKKERGAVGRWAYDTTTYEAGDWYHMTPDVVHSIRFSRNAAVLVFEGPDVMNKSIVLEPFVNGEAIPTADVQPWMFARDGKTKP